MDDVLATIGGFFGDVREAVQGAGSAAKQGKKTLKQAERDTRRTSADLRATAGTARIALYAVAGAAVLAVLIYAVKE